MSASDAHTATDGARQLGGRYRVIKYIAKGGMAEVWEGYDTVLSRPVAIKILLAHLATDNTVLERFRREAVTAAGLTHPGVIATYDTGVDGDTAWIVMELIRGRTLRHLMSERGALDPLLAVSIGGQITDALAAAHRAGLVHRDVKPGNVLLCDDEGPIPRAKVTDFGIAKATEGLGLDLTRTGIVLGTPKYLSPEQVEGIEPDARADLYSLGVVLFEMLTGKAPFSGPTDMATALAHLRDEPPRVSELRPKVPAEIDDIVAGLLVKDREHRTPSALALRQELASAARHLSPGSASTTALNPTPTSAIAGGVGAGGVGAGGVGAGAAGVGRNGTWGQANGSPAVARSAPGLDTGGAGAGPPGNPGGWGPPATAPRRSASATPVGGGTEAFAGAPVPPAGPNPPTRVEGAGASSPPRPPPAYRPPAEPDAPDRRSRRSAPPAPARRGPAIVVACLVVAGVVVLGLLLARAGDGTSGASGPSSPAHDQALALSNPSEFVLNHGSEDNPGELPNLVDGDPSTTWSSAHYDTSTFAGLYSGLGVVVELDGTHTVHDLTVTSPTDGWSAQVYVASSKPPVSGGLAGWGSPAGSVSGASGNATISLNGARGRWVMLWLTNLGPSQMVTIGELSAD